MCVAHRPLSERFRHVVLLLMPLLQAHSERETVLSRASSVLAVLGCSALARPEFLTVMLTSCRPSLDSITPSDGEDGGVQRELQEPLGLRGVVSQLSPGVRQGTALTQRLGRVETARFGAPTCSLEAALGLLGSGERSPAGPPPPSADAPMLVSPKTLLLSPAWWLHHVLA